MKKWILTLSCKDRLGVVAKITTFLHQQQGFILALSQFGDTDTGQFFMRCVFEAQGAPLSPASFTAAFTPLAQELKLTWQLHDTEKKNRTLLLVSTQSHCLNHLLHKAQNGTLPITIAAVGSNHPTLAEMARWYQIPFHHWPLDSRLEPNLEGSKEAQEKQMETFIEENEIELIVLARYMQILSPRLTEKYAGRIINIHHSFLPSFKGAKPYHQAYARGVKLIGATAHYVSDQLDEGPIIDQEVQRVDHAHSPEQLVELGRDIEAFVLARAIKAHIEQRVFINGHKTVVFPQF